VLVGLVGFVLIWLLVVCVVLFLLLSHLCGLGFFTFTFGYCSYDVCICCTLLCVWSLIVGVLWLSWLLGLVGRDLLLFVFRGLRLFVVGFEFLFVVFGW